MFKKMYLSFALMCGITSFAMADIYPEFKSLLRNDVVMEKNTLKIKTIETSDGEVDVIQTTGEVVAIGVLVSSPDSTYFYPDSNLKNVFFDYQKVMDCV